VEDLLYLASQPRLVAMLARILALFVSTMAFQIIVHVILLFITHFRHSFESLLFFLIIWLKLIPLRLSGVLILLTSLSSFLFLFSVHLSQLIEKLWFLLAVLAIIIIIILIFKIRLRRSLILTFHKSILTVILGIPKLRFKSSVSIGLSISILRAGSTFRLSECSKVAYTKRWRRCAPIISCLILLTLRALRYKTFVIVVGNHKRWIFAENFFDSVLWSTSCKLFTSVVLT